MKGALAIIAMACLTAVTIVKIGTNHRENMEKIRVKNTFGQFKPRSKYAQSGFES